MSASVKSARNFGTTNRLDALRLQIMASQHAERIGGRIRARREEMGLKQRQLADLIPSDAVDNQRISDWERGVNMPSARYMEMLADALQRPIAWFHEEAGEPQDTPDLMGALAGTPGQLDRIEAKIDALTKLVAQAELERELAAVDERKRKQARSSAAKKPRRQQEG